MRSSDVVGLDLDGLRTDDGCSVQVDDSDDFVNFFDVRSSAAPTLVNTNIDRKLRT